MIKYEIREHFAKYVTREMAERDIRPWYTAYYGETSESFLRSCLKMKKLPRIDSLIMIAELFECTVNDLLGFNAVEVEPRDKKYDSGLDNKYTVDYLVDQLTRRGFDLDTFQFDEYGMDTEFKRAVKYRRLPATDPFLQICSALDCTPSELLGY